MSNIQLYLVSMNITCAQTLFQKIKYTTDVTCVGTHSSSTVKALPLNSAKLLS